MSWHRGDRIVSKRTGQHGVVEGWKDGSVLVWWGTANQRPERSWELAEEVELSESQLGWPATPEGAKPLPAEMVKDVVTELVLPE